MQGRWGSEGRHPLIGFCNNHESVIMANWLQQTLDLFSDTFFYVLAKLIPGLLTLIAVTIFIRVLGAEQYGYWAICNAIMMFILSFSFGWIRQAILRFKSGSNTRINFNIRKTPINSIIFGIVLTVVICLLSLGSLRFILNYAWITIPISICFLLFIIFFGVFNAWSTYLQAWRLRKTMVFAESFRATMGIIPAIYCATQWGVLGVLIGYSFGYFISACWLALFIKKNYSSSNYLIAQNIPNNREDNWSTWWGYGWPVSVWLALLALIPIIDRLFIQLFLGIVESGVYAASYDIIVRGYSLILFPITLAIHPRIMAAENSGKQNIAYQQLNHSQTISYIILALSMLGILIIYPIFFRYLVKVSTQDALSKGILVMIALGGGLWQIALLAHKPLEIANKTKLMVIGLLLALIVNIVLQVSLLKTLGVLATAIALVLSAFTYITFCKFWSDKIVDKSF